jgi:peptidyl-dipeptidase Dcp
MKFSDVRALREKFWRANMSRCNGGEFDNRPLILEIVNLKHERAQILGFKDYASYELEERMAEKPENVTRFLDRLLKACVKAARAEFQDLETFARKTGEKAGASIDRLEPWDSAYFTEKLKLERLDFNEQELKPYFELKRVVEGAFEVARRLYGIEFKKRTDLPAYHPEVETFEVIDPKLGSLGLLCFDLHPRTSKRGGAWMTTFLDEGYNDQQKKVLRPVVSIVASLTRPTETKPALLDLNEVRTIFHEFGHALHGLLSQAHYRSLSGTNVYWDFVELPSQVMENWTRHPEGLSLFARHFETGKPLPPELCEKIKKVSRFQAGLQSLRQLNFARIDMIWHAGPPTLPSIEKMEDFEKEHLKETMLFDHVPGTMISASFSHIFSGGYSAGYYSYKWAEVLDADAFEAFQETGLFDAKTASLFRKSVLEKGGTEPPQELYRQFRGRDPDPDALLRRDGLIG